MDLQKLIGQKVTVKIDNDHKAKSIIIDSMTSTAQYIMSDKEKFIRKYTLTDDFIELDKSQYKVE